MRGMIMTGKVMVMTFADLVARNTALSIEVRRSHEALKIAQLTIDKMKVELAYLRRMKTAGPARGSNSRNRNLNSWAARPPRWLACRARRPSRVGMTGRSPT